MSDDSPDLTTTEDAPKPKRPLTPRQVEFRGQRSFYLTLIGCIVLAVAAAWLLQVSYVNRHVVLREFEFAYGSARDFGVEMTFTFAEGNESGALPEKVRRLPAADRLLPFARIDQDILSGNGPAFVRQFPANANGRIKLTFHAAPGVEPGLYAGVLTVKDQQGRGEYRYPISLVVRDPWALVKSIGLCCLAVFLLFHLFFLWMNPTPHGELRVVRFDSATSRAPDRAFTETLEKPSWPMRWLFPWRRSFVNLPEIVPEAPAGSDLQFVRRSLFTVRARHLDVATRVLAPDEGPGLEVTLNDDSAASDESPERRDFQGGTPALREISVRANARRSSWICIEPNPENPRGEILPSTRRRPWLVAFQFRRDLLFPDDETTS